MTLPKAISDAIDAYGNKAVDHWMHDHYGTDRATFDAKRQLVTDARAALERAIAEHFTPVAAPQPDGFPNDGKLHAVLRGSVEVNGRKFAYTGTVRNWHTLPGDKPPSKGPLYEIEALNLPFRQTWATGIAENVADAEASLRQVLANIMAAEPVAAPTEAEIEAAVEAHADRWHAAGVLTNGRCGIPTPAQSAKRKEAEAESESLRALMRRAAATTSAPSALERLRVRERVAGWSQPDSILGPDATAAFGMVLRWIDEEAKRNG